MKKDWTYKTLGEVCVAFLRGLTYSKSDEVPTSSNKVLRSNNIDLSSHKLNFDEIKCIREDFVIPDDKKLKEGSIFICMSNGSMQHLGKVAYVDKDYDFAYGGFMGLIVPDKNIVVPKFVYYSLLAPRFLTTILREGRGANINNLKFSDLDAYLIPLHPLAIQRSIVSELDLLHSLIEKKQEQLRALDNLAQSLFYQMFGDPITNPMGWQVKKFAELYKLKSGDGLSAKMFENGPYPVYGGNGISGQHCSYNMDGNYIIIGRVGVYCGNVRNVVGKFWLTDNAFQLFYDEDNNNPIFVTKLLTYLNLNQYANQAAQPVISNITLKDILVPLPPLSLQQSFAAKVSAIEAQKQAITQSIKDVESLLAQRMDHYFG